MATPRMSLFEDTAVTPGSVGSVGEHIINTQRNNPPSKILKVIPNPLTNSYATPKAIT